MNSKAKEAKVTLVRSSAGRTKRVKGVLEALGLRKIGDSRLVDLANAALVGMVKRVQHLVKVECV